MYTTEFAIADTTDRVLVGGARVLIIDDDHDIHALIGAMLKPLTPRISSAFDGAAGIAMGEADVPDIILLDYELPGASGLDVLRELRGIASLSAVPVIIVTGSDNRATLTACFAAGAADYLRKPFVAAELRARVTSVIERQRMLAQLGRAAHLDTLTGLPNRALLQARLQRRIERTQADSTSGFGLMFIDFDRFKLINDSLGHDIGDLLLQEIARRLGANLRPSDSVARDIQGTTVARLGGDEFVVILEDVPSLEATTKVADRLLDALAAPYLLGSHRVRSSASIGLVHSSAGYTSADDMLRDADIAMYDAKSRGKACYAVFSAAKRDAVRLRLETETDLRAAIGTEQIVLVYQPIVSLETRQLEGVEALVRWQHPTRGLIAPDDFIPIAEETRLILPLSDQILHQACRDFARWRDDDPEQAPAYVSVNLSRVQLADPEIVHRTASIVAEYALDPSQVQLEVTESQLMQHRVVAGELLNAFKARGFRLAMDDFGSGYSSLSCLQEYPFDVLKIDRALASNVSKTRGYSALLHAIVTLADNMGLQVVTEGVETIEQVVLLQALGCRAGQGYYFAQPMESSVLEAWWNVIPLRQAGAA